MFQVHGDNDISFTPHNQSIKLLMGDPQTREEAGIWCFHWFEEGEEVIKRIPVPVENYGICNFHTLVSTKVMCDSCPIYDRENIEKALQQGREDRRRGCLLNSKDEENLFRWIQE